MTTPPGWYPDPGHAGNGPAPQRYWDGTAWTAHTQPAEVAPAVTLPGAQPLAPPPLPPLSSGSRRGPLVAGLIAGSVGLAALVVVAFLLIGGGGDGDIGRDRASDRSPSAQVAPSPSPSPSASPGEETPDDPAPDPAPGSGQLTEARAGGVALPLLDGWAEGELPGGIALTAGGYPCPGEPDLRCVDANAFLYLLPGLRAVPPEEYARADIGENESESYTGDSYGAITSRDEILAEAVTVAGQDGYRVRRRIETESGVEAFVESVAFPAPDGSDALVVLRLGLDIGSGPTADDLDAIVRGASSTSAGPGTEV